MTRRWRERDSNLQFPNTSASVFEAASPVARRWHQARWRATANPNLRLTIRGVSFEWSRCSVCMPQPVRYRGLDQPAIVRGDRRINQLGPDRLQRLESAALVRADQSCVAGDIGRQDRSEPAGGGHSSGIPASRRPAK